MSGVAAAARRSPSLLAWSTSNKGIATSSFYYGHVGVVQVDTVIVWFKTTHPLACQRCGAKRVFGRAHLHKPRTGRVISCQIGSTGKPLATKPLRR